MGESSEETPVPTEPERESREDTNARREWESRDREWESRDKARKEWRLFAWACLGVFTLLALLVILSGVLADQGPLAQSKARERDAAQAEELRITASTEKARLVGESIQAASVLASTLAPAALQAGAAGQHLLRNGEDLTAQFLKDVGFPLGKDAATTVGRAIWNRYVKSPKRPSTPVAPVVLPGTNGRATSTINLTIVIHQGRRPQVITKVVRVADGPD